MTRGLYFSKAARFAACSSAIVAMVVAVAPPAQAATTANLLKNPGAEASTGTNLHGWTHTTGTTLAAAKYGSANGFPTQGSPGPSNRGKNFFVGGKDADFSNEVAVQTISLSKYVTKIKGGKVKLNVNGWFGGFANQNDTAG